MCISNGIRDDSIISALSAYKIDTKSITALKDYLNSLHSNNAEIIYNRLFDDVMKNSQEYISLPERASKVVCLKFTEFFITSLNKKETVNQVTTKNLTGKEVEGLKYLGGYVIRKLFMKLKTTKNKHGSDEQAMQILLVEKGLWMITEDNQKVFIITEKYFCVQIALLGLRVININKLVDKLTNFSPLLAIFHHIVSDCGATVNHHVKMNILSSILTLYLRVLIFSLAKGHCCKTEKENI